jgi:hypothetical protein
MSTGAAKHTLWFDAARARRFLVPDEAELPPGDFAVRTSLGRERTVDETALAPFEVTAEEAKAWSKEQLGAVLGEVRGKAMGFVERLRERTAEMRGENREAWERGVAGAPDDVKAAAGKVRDGLRDLGEALQRAARAHTGETEPPAPPEASADASADKSVDVSADASVDGSVDGSAGASADAKESGGAETAGVAVPGAARTASADDAVPSPHAKWTEKPLTGAPAHPNIAGPET